jgi:hypothetical protein
METKVATEERTEEWSATMSRAAEASEQTYAIRNNRTQAKTAALKQTRLRRHRAANTLA